MGLDTDNIKQENDYLKNKLEQIKELYENKISSLSSQNRIKDINIKTLKKRISDLENINPYKTYDEIPSNGKSLLNISDNVDNDISYFSRNDKLKEINDSEYKNKLLKEVLIISLQDFNTRESKLLAQIKEKEEEVIQERRIKIKIEKTLNNEIKEINNKLLKEQQLKNEANETLKKFNLQLKLIEQRFEDELRYYKKLAERKTEELKLIKGKLNKK